MHSRKGGKGQQGFLRLRKWQEYDETAFLMTHSHAEDQLSLATVRHYVYIYEHSEVHVSFYLPLSHCCVHPSYAVPSKSDFVAQDEGKPPSSFT